MVDPIDGTANFAAGLPLFGVMAAAIVRGEVVAAAIHDPIGDDMALALRGEGAWTRGAGWSADRASRGRAGAGGADDRQRVVALPAGAAAQPGLRQSAAARRRAGTTAAPRTNTAWPRRATATYLFFNRLMPWDHAPGWLLHQEAGGYSARLDGSPYTPLRTDGGLICAPDRDSWQAVRGVLLAR